MDQQTHYFLKKDNSSGESELEDIPIKESRRIIEESLVRSTIQLESVTDIKVPTPEGEVPLRIYIPNKDKSLPVFISIHGGGWVFGSLNTHDSFCRSVAKQANTIIVSIDYRLAPEHKYPAGLNDCYAAALWTIRCIQEWGGKPDCVSIGGISAGANLAAAVVLRLKQERLFPFQKQVLVVPVIQRNFETSSYKKYATGYYLSKKLMEWFWEMYVDTDENAMKPTASLLNALDVSKLPPTLFALAEFDPLYDEGLAYAEKLKASDVPVTIYNYPTIHGFTSIEELEIGKKAISDIASFLKH
jgi:acetyl esterase